MEQWFKDRFHPRARVGGEDWFGQHYVAGEFLPFYVPRPVMPQIEEEDYPDFIEFAASQGVEILVRYHEPSLLHPHQRLDKLHAERMPPEVRRKTIFASMDLYILDGNHRWMLHVQERSVVPCYQIKLPFEEAIALMFAFPKTYALENNYGKD